MQLIALGATFSRDLYNRFLHPESNLDELPYSKLVSRLAIAFSVVAGITGPFNGWINSDLGLFSASFPGLCEFRPTQCFGDGHAAATGHYAGRHAVKYALNIKLELPDPLQVNREKRRIYAPLSNNPAKSVGCKELNMGISKTMRNYCGEIKHDELLDVGLKQLQYYEHDIVPQTFAYNPHELTRLLEVFNILTVSEIIIHACMARKSDCKPLHFVKKNSNKTYTKDNKMLIVLKKHEDRILTDSIPTDFFGDLVENYEKYNMDYINEKE